MSDRRERQWRFYVEDMLRFARAALEHTDGFDLPALLADR